MKSAAIIKLLGNGLSGMALLAGIPMPPYEQPPHPCGNGSQIGAPDRPEPAGAKLLADVAF